MADQPKSDPFIEALAAEALTAIRKAEALAESARVYQLAFWPDDERALPEDFIACALFTASKATSYVTRLQLASINGLSVIFTGKRLTQVHADVWMGIMHLARSRPEGTAIWFRERELLELIGRHTHQGQREQLKKWLSQLTATEVLIQDDSKKQRYGGTLLPWRSEYDGDGHTIFAVDINRDLARILSGNFLAHLDWQVRKNLQNKPLALWLQTYFQRFKRPVPLAQVHALSGSTSSIKKFRQNIVAALEELHAAGGPSARLDRETDTVLIVRRPAPRPRRAANDGQEVLPFVRRDTVRDA